MARQSSRGSAKDPQARRGRPEPAGRVEPDATGDDAAVVDGGTGPVVDDDLDTDDLVDDEILDGPDDEAGDGVRSARTDAFWAEVRIDPVEIALPGGVGYTLRAYRPSTEVVEPEIEDRDEDFVTLRGSRADEEDDEDPGIDEAELTRAALAAGRAGERSRRDTDVADGDDEYLDDEDLDDEDIEDLDEDDELAEEEEPDEEADTEPEEVPVFLSRRGKVLLFRSAEGLVGYVRGADEHELAQLDTWAQVRERIEPADVVPLDEDRYELDLVVGNLRGGHDAWDPGLIIQAGEIARDLAYALRLRPVITALAPGSPLDDLDEGLRTMEEGGFRAIFARRRVRKIDPQTTAALGWRTIIGKISAATDWRN